MIREGLYYTKEHEWLRVEGTVAVIGISNFAQQALGDLTFIELPKPGKTVKAGDSLAVVESVKAASDIYAPVGGTVEAVNTTLVETPELINQEPYDGGWICLLSNWDQAGLKTC